jgi:RNA polymerase sigma factor (sigma-70 family)
MSSDRDLLCRYLADGSEAAFTALVQRHINLVYRTALRRVGGNAHAADDVTQRVFTSLARKANALTDRVSLAGWLYTSARFAASDLVRAERRRRTHEEEAHTMNELNAPIAIATERLEPLLDEVLELLPEKDREAVLLHFFEGLSFVDVGQSLSIGPDAARMRVNRALERLRQPLSDRGVASTAAALAGALSTQSAIAAGMPAAAIVAGQALTAAAAAGSASVVTTVLTAIKFSRAAPWIGGAIAVGLFTLTVQQLWPSNETPVSSQPPLVEIAEVDLAAPVETATATTPFGPPSTSATATPANPLRPALGRQGFADLTNAEKSILKILWKNQSVITAPRKRWAMSVSPSAPNYSNFEAGRQRLIDKGFVAVGGDRGLIHLTAAGIQFCTVHRDLLEAHPTSNSGG